MKLFTNTSLLLTIIFFISSYTFAQDKNNQSSLPTAKKAVVFKIPENLTPNDMPKPHKGMLMLDLKSPSGLFIAYTPGDQKSADYISVLREMIAKFFIHEKDAVFRWKETALPSSEKFPNETGEILTATVADDEVQVVVYTRTIAAGQDVVYGYFARKDLKKPSNSAEFADNDGKGIKQLDNFRKKLTVSK